MPSPRHHHHGHLYLQFDVKFPEVLSGPDGPGSSLSDAQIKALQSVLPPPIMGPTPPPNAMTDDYQLEDVDPTREGARAQGATGEDDDDEMGGHGERVQCASQ